jgi:hypothetical protein
MPRTVITDEHGKYLIETLSRGHYSVTAALRGFEPWSIDLDVDGGSTTMDVVLRALSFSERVTVSATKTGASMCGMPATVNTSSARGTSDCLRSPRVQVSRACGARSSRCAADARPRNNFSQTSGSPQDILWPAT